MRAIRNGPPFLQRYLPFWLANLVERMWLAMGLIIALALPLSRIVPPLYTLPIPPPGAKEAVEKARSKAPARGAPSEARPRRRTTTPMAAGRC